jgi:hypothetical protein
MPQLNLTDNVYEGTLDIGGVINTSLVHVYFSDGGCSVAIRDGTPSLPGWTRKELHLAPFNVGMLRAQDSETMAEGIRYKMEGTNLGVVTYGPLGHPADGEYDFHHVSRFELLSKYTAKEMTVSIEGATHWGTPGLREHSAKIPPLSFHVAFTVPLAGMESFFGIPHEYFADFEKRVKACARIVAPR